MTGPQTLQSTHHLKREMIFFRKQVWPLRVSISGDSSLLKQSVLQTPA
jgi:hypothetical protein